MSASYTYTEEIVMLNMEEVQSTHVYHWTGEDAGSLAEYIDTNIIQSPAHLGNLMDIVSLMNSKDT